jgi:hypothetical protein
MESRKANKSGTASGTSGASYVEILRADLRGYGAQGKFIGFLRNTHGANTLYYKVDIYAVDGGTLFKAGKVETSIAASTTIEITTTEVPYNGIVVVSVKQNSGAGGYLLEWMTF